MAHEEVLKILQSMKTGQPFTVEQIIRKFGEKKGEEFDGLYESEKAGELEKALNEEGLIKEFGTTKLYIKS